MELKFLGRGSGFNVNEGSTSAYFIDSDELFLIDCGESTFKSLIMNNILDNIHSINIMITHTHSDHVGSLGNLILYSYYNLKVPVKIISPKTGFYIEKDIEKLLDIFGCTKDMYSMVLSDYYDNKYKTFHNINYTSAYHGDILKCYSITFFTNEGLVYYSGDSSKTFLIEYAIESNSKIDKMYVDVTIDEVASNVHLSLDKLDKIVPKELRSKVYCMHVNSDECIKRIKEIGFNVVEIE